MKLLQPPFRQVQDMELLLLQVVRRLNRCGRYPSGERIMLADQKAVIERRLEALKQQMTGNP